MSQPNGVPEKTGAGDHIHGNYHAPQVYEAEPGRYDGTTPGQQSVDDERAWMDAKATAPEISQGAGARGV